MRLFILATCRNEELIPYALLVFKSLRIGFPTSDVYVYGNNLADDVLLQVSAACKDLGCSFKNDKESIYHEWVDYLISSNKEPFWICDTDMIFYSSVEGFQFNTALAGFRVPEFFDEFTGAITRSRLHTSLLYIDPFKFDTQIEKYNSQFPVTPFNPRPASPVAPLCISFNGRGYFYDVMAQAYHAISGTAFTAEQKDAFFHFNFGTVSDVVLPRLFNGKEMQLARDAVLNNPELGRGAWRFQEQHYASRQPVFDGVSVITPVMPEEASKAREWNREVCKGNAEAMSFSELWYGYVHSIDDCLDSSLDGRPIMSKEQMISVFFCACLLYNHPYYIRHQSMLYPIILETTNLYKLSVGWERSPNPQLRTIADVLRSCGLKMHTMIALLCGGEAHMIDIARRMYEADYAQQHDANGRPI